LRDWLRNYRETGSGTRDLKSSYRRINVLPKEVQVTVSTITAVTIRRVGRQWLKQMNMPHVCQLSKSVPMITESFIV
jgi:hypothetical protein